MTGRNLPLKAGEDVNGSRPAGPTSRLTDLTGTAP
jgi:hypothetical protein